MQTDEWTIANITGANLLVAWFGSWPSFHDAEIIRAHFERRGISYLEIHTWEMTAEIDPSGAYVRDKRVVVTFKLQDVEDLELYGFSQQNVISGLTVGPVENGIEITLEGCFGLEGRVVAARVDLEISPGPPANTDRSGRDGKR